jgi:hypothetical protein
LKLTLLSLLLALVVAATPVRGQTIAVELSEQVEALAKKYSLSVELDSASFPVKTSHGSIDGKPPTPEQLARYGPVFVKEWQIYPASLVARTKLKRIVLCAELAFAGQRRTAVPDFEHDALYLDVERGMHSLEYVRKVIHHEFFHIIDWRDDGELYRDLEWSKLNPAEFHYGNGGVNAQDDATMSLDTPGQIGFLNKYATTGVEEDKAEVFAYLIVVPKHLEKRLPNDEVLGAKVRRMRSLLERFCPDMNADFWKTMDKPSDSKPME